MIQVQLSEEHYWILAQAVSAAGTASHRHGMTRHAERFHEAEKNLFRAYEQAENTDEYRVKIHRMGRDVEKYSPLNAGGMAEVVSQMKETYPDCEISVEVVK